MKKNHPSIGRLYAGRDVVECPECGEPEPFLGLFLRAGRGKEARLWRLEWITHAPEGFARWVQRAAPRWRRAKEIYVNHCGCCGSPLADPVGFQTGGGWLCDTGLDAAVSARGNALTVAGFSPGAVVLPEGHGLWEDGLRMTVRALRRHFRDLPRFTALLPRTDRRLFLTPAPAPHRWRLTEAGQGKASEESFFSFAQAQKAAVVRWNIRPAAWRPE